VWLCQAIHRFEQGLKAINVLCQQRLAVELQQRLHGLPFGLWAGSGRSCRLATVSTRGALTQQDKEYEQQAVAHPASSGSEVIWER